MAAAMGVLKKQTTTTTTTVQPHVVLLPFNMMSHLTPLVELARLFTFHDLKVTIIATPHNALIFQSSIDNDCHVSGFNISIQTLKFPSYELGLPEGIENLSATTSTDIAGKVHYGYTHLLQQPMEQLIRELNPHCIVSDSFFPWTVDLAEELHIPRFSFYASNIFHQCAWHCLNKYTPHKNVDSDSESFLIPGLPHEIIMKRSEIEDFSEEINHVKTLDSILQADLRSHGIIHNTCYELEAGYVELYENIRGKKCWHVGPLSLFINKLEEFKSSKQISNSNSSSTFDPWKDYSDCLSWLENQEPNSVLFVCFGSSTRFPNDQLREISLALKAANCPFILVVRNQVEKDDHNYDDLWLDNDKGFIIKGWAPQVLILKHRAVGGFMTHCGWNSILEALTLGIPLITWPIFAEQFYTDKLLEQLGLTIRVGADVWNYGFIVSSPVVSRDKIELAVKRLMYDSDESRKIRANVKLMAETLKNATEEGGSSHSHLVELIEEIKCCAFNNSA